MSTSEVELKALMIGGLDGDAAAHMQLLSALVPLLRRFYGRRVTDPSDAEDLVQETLIALHARRATYDRDRPFTAWLYAIARYRMVDYFRRHRETISIEDMEEMLMIEGFEEAVAARIDIDRLLSVLPPKQARVIRDTRVEGRSVAEAAASAGIGESDVKISIHRGLKALTVRIRRS